MRERESHVSFSCLVVVTTSLQTKYKCFQHSTRFLVMFAILESLFSVVSTGRVKWDTCAGILMISPAKQKVRKTNIRYTGTIL